MTNNFILMSRVTKRKDLSKTSEISLDLSAILKKNLNRMTFVYILKNFRMYTIVIEALARFSRMSCINV